jgi:RNA-directed DNA polymerase
MGDARTRVMESVISFLTRRLELRVNRAKSAVAQPAARKFLGFSFTVGRTSKRRIAPKALARFKARVRILTQRTRGIDLGQMVQELATYLRGWRGYFAFCQTPRILAGLDSWIHRRLRCVMWKQWKHGPRRFAELRRRGVRFDLAIRTAGSPHGPWHLSQSPALHAALPIAYFTALGLPRLADGRNA